MQYLISFLEGVITFISPCLLPMPCPSILFPTLPAVEREISKDRSTGALGFVAGFTIVFVALGALAGTAGSFLLGYRTAVNIVSGLIVICFGLNYLGIFRLNIFKGSSRRMDMQNMGFLSALMFGVIFSVGWTPCVGAFLGSALILASQQGHVLQGTLMLLTYSMGLGLPFILSALLIDYLKSAFNWIKSHYSVINAVCGGLLRLIGLLMATGTLGKIISLLS